MLLTSDRTPTGAPRILPPPRRHDSGLAGALVLVEMTSARGLPFFGKVARGCGGRLATPARRAVGANHLPGPRVGEVNVDLVWSYPSRPHGVPGSREPRTRPAMTPGCHPAGRTPEEWPAAALVCEGRRTASHPDAQPMAGSGAGPRAGSSSGGGSPLVWPAHSTCAVA